MVIWITGLSGAGKTMISEALCALVKPRLPELVLVDGDVVRDLFGGSLGYEEADRVIQIGRLQRLACFLNQQGQLPVVAALYSHPDLLAWNREHLPGYFEVLIDAPIQLVASRDPKGLYRKAAAVEQPKVVGLDIPWHRPTAPDLVIDPDDGATPEQAAGRIARAVPRLAGALEVS
ncbi:MAG: adenylyl-sulfate kinase [Alphaproteobacteria bacterium]|jgi:adenylylsulfate kinase|nr:adenylyl-sulfate kinase [Alphaproteobacteria bacterium]MDP7487397.1 adenylyl-sulfate kinase [Alphaproteobacteria bacterium]